MYSKYGASQNESENIAGFARTKSDGYSTSDSTTVTKSLLKTLHAQNLPQLDPTSNTGDQSMRATENDPSTTMLLPRSKTLPEVSTKSTNIASRRGFEFNLSSRFDELTKSISYAGRETADAVFRQNLVNVVPEGASKHPIIRSSSLGPPTPPHEAESLSWLPLASTGHVQATNEATTNGLTPTAANTVHSRGCPVAASGEGVLSAVQPFSSQNVSGVPWLLRAFRVATQTLDIHLPISSTKVISQVLPPKAADQRTIKTYEVVCDYLQQILAEPRYISITHALAVSSNGVEDFPKSPPVTPGFHDAEGYFGDQTIFTHAAEVAVHHEFRDTNSSLPLPPQRHIMSAEANLIILERYIPPATIDEMYDFLSADSCRSYLADRLPELAVEYGSLLLVYPTRSGGHTFASRYVAPLLDPLLREMTILRNLNTNAAERLGRMRALDSMLDIDDMKSRLETFCTSMNTRNSIKKSRSTFVLAHSETAQVVLDRDSWMTWFVEQEQSRMKQDLVDYHKDGGRLPEGKGGKTDITPGMLTREIVEGLQKSTAAAGNSSIEVGVFVIRRVRRPAAG